MNRTVLGGLEGRTRSCATLICTMNRPDELRLGLERLSRCDPLPSEIVVSDDSAADDTRTELICGQFAGVKYQRGPRRGLAANRNAALAATGAAYLHFIDDDVLVPPDFYSVVDEMLDAAGDWVVLTGFEFRHNGNADVAKVEPPRAGFWAHLGDGKLSGPNCVVINAAVFPTSLFKRTAFDEYFKYGYEESDITLQAIASGYRLIYEPMLHVDHYPSKVNRGRYKGWVVASQVYAGLKRQWVFEKNGIKTIGFVLIAVPRLLVFTLRHHGAVASGTACRQAGRGVAHFVRHCILNGRSGTKNPPPAAPGAKG